MAITVVQVAQASPGSTTPWPISFVSAPTPGNSVILAVGANNGGSVSTVSDNQTGNTFVRGPHAQDSRGGGFCTFSEVWYVGSVAYQSGTYTVNINPVNAGGSPGIFLIEVSGLSGSIDKQGIASDTSGANTTLSVTASGANASANSLVVTLFFKPSAITDWTAAPTSGYTGEAVFNANSQGISSTGGYKIVSSIETSSATAPTFSSNYVSGAIATFGAAAGSISVTPSVGGLTLGGIAPTVTKPTVTAPTALVGSLVLVGVASTITKPTVALPNPLVATLTLTGAVVTQTLTVPAVGTGSLAFVAAAPVVPRVPAVGTMTFNGVAATLGLGIAPSVGTLAPNGVAPFLNFGMAVSSGALTFLGQTAAPVQNSARATSAASLSLAGVGPQWALSDIVGAGSLAFGAVNSSLGITVNTGAGVITLAGSAPVLAGLSIIVPSVGSLGISGVASRFDIGETPNAALITLNGQIATLTQAAKVSPAAGSVLLTGNLPLFGIVSIAPDTAMMLFAGQTAPASSLAIMPLGGQIVAASEKTDVLPGYTASGLYLLPLPAAIPTMKAGVY